MISYYDIYEEEYQFIETLLKGGSVLEVGFRSISFFGNFDGSGWSKNSPHIIIKAIK